METTTNTNDNYDLALEVLMDNASPMDMSTHTTVEWFDTRCGFDGFIELPDGFVFLAVDDNDERLRLTTTTTHGVVNAEVVFPMNAAGIRMWAASINVAG